MEFMLNRATNFRKRTAFIGIDVIDNGLNGIALLGGFNNQVIGCTIEDNNSGKLSGGYGGIALMNGSGTIERSRISNNGCAGIYINEAVDVSIDGNLIFDNPEGIRVGFVSDVTISSNTIADNASGLVIEDGALPHIPTTLFMTMVCPEPPMTYTSKVLSIPQT